MKDRNDPLQPLKMGNCVTVEITNEKGETVSFKAIGVDYNVSYDNTNFTEDGQMYRISSRLERILTLRLLNDEVTMKRKSEGKDEIEQVQVQDLFAKRRSFDFSQTKSNGEEIK